MNTPLLEIRNLQVTFGSGRNAREIIHDLSFSVYPGEILSLVGESGCGKSVTALSILNLLPRQGKITGGQILFEGKDLVTLSRRDLDKIRGQDISMIFQDIMYSLNPVLSIGKQMTEGMICHMGISQKEARLEAIKLLTRTGIRDPEQTLHKYPHQLSGGMRQRVMIAMALACHPQLLIADEPTTALDVTIQLQIIELLRELQKETGMSILLITHDLGVVAELADRVIVLYAGECLEQADTRTLLEQPAHAYTQALIRSVPGLHDHESRILYAIPGSVPERYDQLTGCRFQTRCEHRDSCKVRDNPVLHDVDGHGHLARCKPEGVNRR